MSRFNIFRKLKEKISVSIVKNPSRAVLLLILLLNLLLFTGAAVIISLLAPKSLEHSGFWASVFYTISMVLDAGCIQYVIEDIGQASVGLILVCMLTVILGMIIFTGAVIGYVTNYISSFIDNSKSGARAVHVSGHTVILNWNNRASEIVNDLLYTGNKEVIIVLSEKDPEDIERELSDRRTETLRRENKEIKEYSESMPLFRRMRYRRRNKMKDRLTVIIRQGDTYSSKQLDDISLSQAKTVILLNEDVNDSLCKYNHEERLDSLENGNANTIKALVQVAEITSAENSRDDQVIVVEIEDNWTLNLVNKIIAHKEKLGKCNIIPVPVNKILGQVLSQFSIMPELNTVYSDLFSNKGAEFFCTPHKLNKDTNKLISDYLDKHYESIPLTITETKIGPQAFYIAQKERQFNQRKRRKKRSGTYTVKPNPNYWIEQKNIVILGHNSKSEEIMNGFDAFRREWNLPDGSEILNVMVIDDKKSLERHNYYESFPYVKNVIEADLRDNKQIYEAISSFVNENDEDTSVLILSDDTVPPEDIDSSALTYLIYVQDIIFDKMEHDPSFRRESIDVVVEIINPKNYDVVHNYSVNNVVISNRYISKMVTQISRKGALYDFYQDILTYDDEDSDGYESKELYVKKVSSFFNELPGPCTAAELIRAVFNSTPENNKAIAIGYTNLAGDLILFEGDQDQIPVELKQTDKLIIFSNH